jgi:FMN-dependent NADH-azoreductase
MERLLYIEASPRKKRSASIQVSKAFLAAYREANPGDQIETFDIWAEQFPDFNESVFEAKYAGLSGVQRTQDQEKAWASIRTLARPFLAADKLLLGVPLWNFGIPYRLKQLIDLITHKDILFSFDGQNFQGLMKAQKAAVVYARGLDYQSSHSPTPAEFYDLQKPYVEMWLRFLGVTSVESIIVEKTLFGPEVDRASRQEAEQEAALLASRF